MTGSGGSGGSGGGAGGGSGGARAGAGGVPTRILRSPWEGDIDLATKTGKSLWDEGIKPMEEKFMGYGKDLVRFLAQVKNRVNKCHWQGIITINNKSLITQYSEITLADVKQDRDLRKLTPRCSGGRKAPNMCCNDVSFHL